MVSLICCQVDHHYRHYCRIAVIGVEPAVKYSFAESDINGQYNTELTLSPRLHVKPRITAIRASSSGTYISYININGKCYFI